MDFKALIKETKESKEKREGIVKNMLINFGEHCEMLGGIKKIPAKTIENWAVLMVLAVEKN